LFAVEADDAGCQQSGHKGVKAAMASQMRGNVTEEVQIARSVVSLVAVDVVDNFTSAERSSKNVLHCCPVGQNPDGASAVTVGVVPDDVASVGCELVPLCLSPADV
jgi:hypothetical protein